VFGYDSGGSLNSNVSIASKAPSSSTTIELSISSTTPAATSVATHEDRLWFFGSYDRRGETDLSTRINVPAVIASPVVVYQLNVAHSLPNKVTPTFTPEALARSHVEQLVNLSLFGDPTTNAGAIFALSGPPSCSGNEQAGGNGHRASLLGRFRFKLDGQRLVRFAS